MADIKLPDRPTVPDKQDYWTAKPVTDMCMIDIADGSNWLQAYNKGHLPAVRFLAGTEASTGNTSYSFIFPSTLPNASSKNIVITVGYYGESEIPVSGNPRARSSNNTTYVDSTYVVSNPDSVSETYSGELASETDSKVIYNQIILPVDNGSPYELFEVDLSCSGFDICYLSAWELPNNVSDYSGAGGISRNKARIDVSTSNITNSYDMYVGSQLDASMVGSLYANLNNARINQRQILAHVASINYGNGVSSGSEWQAPYGGIYIKPTALVNGQRSNDYYTTCKWAIFGASDGGTTNVWIESSGLSESSSNVAVTDNSTENWWPGGGNDVTTWDNSTAMGTCNVLSNGDYVYIHGLTSGVGATGAFTRFIIWAENS